LSLIQLSVPNFCAQRGFCNGQKELLAVAFLPEQKHTFFPKGFTLQSGAKEL
jgi:hypothetical protein